MGFLRCSTLAGLLIFAYISCTPTNIGETRVDSRKDKNIVLERGYFHRHFNPLYRIGDCDYFFFKDSKRSE
jgi:hypothetical protein